jgi:hypothetical protein
MLTYVLLMLSQKGIVRQVRHVANGVILPEKRWVLVRAYCSCREWTFLKAYGGP